MNTRLSFVTSLGALSVALAGLTPACGSDKGPGGGVIDGGGSLLDGGGGSSGGGNTGGAANNTGGSSGSPSVTPIGQPCRNDSECGVEGLICLTPKGNEFDGAGVANGVCSLDCSKDLTAVTSADSTCAPIDSTAICLGITPSQAYCVESCTPGAVPSTEMKCHGRHDTACADPMEQGLGYCQPTCRGDFDCMGRGDNAVCDLGSGTCVDKLDPARNLPMGSKCDPTPGVEDHCQGSCVGILEGDASTTTVGFCSGLCKLGEAGCGVDITSNDPADAYCLFGTSSVSDLGDIGFCAQLCDCNDDCRNPDFICNTVSGLKMQIGRLGACGPKSGAPSSEPNGVACTNKPPAHDAGNKKEDAGNSGTPDAGAPPVDAGPG